MLYLIKNVFNSYIIKLCKYKYYINNYKTQNIYIIELYLSHEYYKIDKNFEFWCLDIIFIIYFFSLFEIYFLETYRNVL